MRVFKGFMVKEALALNDGESAGKENGKLDDNGIIYRDM